MHWKELQKQISKFPEDRQYFQTLGQLKWDKAEQISRNIAICCDFLDKSPGSQIDKQKLEEVWFKTVEPLADCVEDVFLERHGMLRAIDKKEYGVECAGEAIQRMYDALTSLTELTRCLQAASPQVSQTIRGDRRSHQKVLDGRGGAE